MTGPTSILFNFALRVSPADREVWFKAMQREFEFMPPSQRFRFATGCLAAAIVWRIWTPQGVRRITQGGLVAASASLAALVTVNSLLGTFGHLGPVMAGLGLAYAGGAVATARWGLTGMAAFALAGLALNTVLVTVWADGSAEPGGFIRALSVEAYLILAIFLGATAVARALANHLERSA